MMAIGDQIVFSRTIAEWASLTIKSVQERWTDLWEDNAKLYLLLCGGKDLAFLDQPLWEDWNIECSATINGWLNSSHTSINRTLVVLTRDRWLANGRNREDTLVLRMDMCLGITYLCSHSVPPKFGNSQTSNPPNFSQRELDDSGHRQIGVQICVDRNTSVDQKDTKWPTSHDRERKFSCDNKSWNA